jgi:hypothetical protein
MCSAGADKTSCYSSIYKCFKFHPGISCIPAADLIQCHQAPSAEVKLHIFTVVTILQGTNDMTALPEPVTVLCSTPTQQSHRFWQAVLVIGLVLLDQLTTAAVFLHL